MEKRALLYEVGTTGTPKLDRERDEMRVRMIDTGAVTHSRIHFTVKDELSRLIIIYLTVC